MEADTKVTDAEVNAALKCLFEELACSEDIPEMRKALEAFLASRAASPQAVALPLHQIKIGDMWADVAADALPFYQAQLFEVRTFVAAPLDTGTTAATSAETFKHHSGRMFSDDMAKLASRVIELENLLQASQRDLAETSKPTAAAPADMSEGIAAIVACLGDDAASLREKNPECEIAANMEEAATLIERLSTAAAPTDAYKRKNLVLNTALDILQRFIVQQNATNITDAIDLLNTFHANMSALASAQAVPPVAPTHAAIWQPIACMLSEHQHNVLWLYCPDLVHEEENPAGVVDGHWQDGEGWVGAVWNAYQSCWDYSVVNPTHWMVPFGPDALEGNAS